MPIATLPSPTALQGATSLTTFKVKVAGSELEGIIRIAIDKAFNCIPKAFVLVEDGDVAAQNFEKSERDYITPGSEVEITVGYNSNEELLFKGVLTMKKIKVTRSGRTHLELIFKDVAYKMSLDKKSRYFKDVSEQDILEKLVQDYEGISSEYDSLTLAAANPLRHPSLIQHNTTDWDYLIKRVEQSSALVQVDQGTIKVHGIPTFTFPSFGLEFGRDIISMDLELNSENQYQRIKSLSWDEKTHEIIEAESDRTNLPDQGNLSSGDLASVGQSNYILKHSGNVSEQQLQQWANSKQLKSELSRIQGTLSFQGSALAKLGAYITVGGSGSRFNGPCLISGVNHTIQQGDWVTTVQIGIDQSWHGDRHRETELIEHIASGSINGLYTGIVQQIEGDPLENSRILVNIPVVQKDEEGTWMRLASFDASENKGFMTRPEIGDEVVLGFLNNDINQGIVLGALFSQKHPGSDLLPHSDKNNKKGWVLKEGMHLLFDTADDIVELTTAVGNKVLIDQEVIEITDQHSNKITLDSDGITCTSNKDFSIKANGKLVLEAKNIEIKASAGLKAKGSTANFEGSSMTTIKGNPVNIN